MTGKTTLLVLIPCALLYWAPLWAQDEDSASDNQNDASRDNVEEVIVRGRRLSDFRSALEAARVRVYGAFNELNSDDAFDVQCRDEASTGTRMRRHVCRPRFENDISNAAAKAWVYSIKEACPGGLRQDCIFSEYAQTGISRAQAQESRLGPMQEQFAVEFARVVSESPELQQAILDYQDLERAYEDARGRRR